MPAYTLTKAWAQVSADVSGVTLVQVRGMPGPNPDVVELIASASPPAASGVGMQLITGESILVDAVPSLGASGALFGRTLTNKALIVVFE